MEDKVFNIQLERNEKDILEAILIALIGIFIAIIFIGLFLANVLISRIEYRNIEIKVIGEEKVEVKTQDQGAEYIGVVSYYSHKGCIGCSENQIMANGELFDETIYTLAFNDLPLNTLVEVENLDNSIIVIAKVTDRGGFNALGRIADLSLGLCQAIQCKTDVSSIKITALNM